jgi:hypothetical protein
VTALDANAAGDAAAVVSIPVRGRVRVAGYKSWLFTRRRGAASFRKRLQIGRQTVGMSPAALDLNGSGDVLVAWDDREDVRARTITASGTIGREQRLGQGGSADVFGGRMSAAIDPTRRMLVAWVAQRVGQGNNAGSPGLVALAYASPSRSFGRAQILQRDLPTGANRAILGPGVRATLLRDRGVVVWSGFAGGRFAVRAVDVVSGRARAASTLSPSTVDARLRGLAVGPRGGLVATWSSTGAAGPGLFAVPRAPGAPTWAAAENVVTTAAGDAGLPGDAPVAADPVSGVTVALWSDPLPTGPPAPIPVRFATRPPTG